MEEERKEKVKSAQSNESDSCMVKLVIAVV